MDPFVIGSLISAGGSLLSGLFGRKKQKQPTRVTPQQIRDEALAAGFNPLTVLGASSGGGFGMNPAPATNLSSMELIGDALGGIGNAIAGQDPVAAETKRLENELLRRQIAAADDAARAQRTDVQPLYGIGRNNIPSVERVDTGVVRRGGPRIARADRPDDAKRLADVEEVPPGAVRMTMTPDPFVNSGTAPSTAFLGPNAVNLPSWEENYGEPGEWIGGLWNLSDMMAYRSGRWLGNELIRRDKSAKSRALERYYRTGENRPSWYKGGRRPKEAPFGAN